MRHQYGALGGVPAPVHFFSFGDDQSWTTEIVSNELSRADQRHA